MARRIFTLSIAESNDVAAAAPVTDKEDQKEIGLAFVDGDSRSHGASNYYDPDTALSVAGSCDVKDEP